MKEIYVEQIETYPEDIMECVKNRSDHLQKYVNSRTPKDAFLFNVLYPMTFFGQKTLSSRCIKNFGI